MPGYTTFTPVGFQDVYVKEPLAASPEPSWRTWCNGRLFVVNAGYFVWQKLVNHGPRCAINSVNISIEDRGAGYSSVAKAFIYYANGYKIRESQTININWNGTGAIEVISDISGAVIGYADSHIFNFNTYYWDTDEVIYLVYCSPGSYYYSDPTYLTALPATTQDIYSTTSYPTYPGYGSYPAVWKYGYHCDYALKWYYVWGGCSYPTPYGYGVPSSWLSNPPGLDQIPAGCQSTDSDFRLHFWFDADRGVDKVEQGGVPLTVSGVDQFKVGPAATSNGIDIQEVWKFADVRVFPYYTQGDPLNFEWPFHPNMTRAGIRMY